MERGEFNLRQLSLHSSSGSQLNGEVAVASAAFVSGWRRMVWCPALWNSGSCSVNPARSSGDGCRLCTLPGAGTLGLASEGLLQSRERYFQCLLAGEIISWIVSKQKSSLIWWNIECQDTPWLAASLNALRDCWDSGFYCVSPLRPILRGQHVYCQLEPLFCRQAWLGRVSSTHERPGGWINVQNGCGPQQCLTDTNRAACVWVNFYKWRWSGARTTMIACPGWFVEEKFILYSPKLHQSWIFLKGHIKEC